MKTPWRFRLSFVAVLASLALPAGAQEFRGRVNGIITDETGAVLPGVTVTATSPALIQPQVTTTGGDGVYRLIALPAGLYQLEFKSGTTFSRRFYAATRLIGSTTSTGTSAARSNAGRRGSSIRTGWTTSTSSCSGSTSSRARS